MFLAYRTKRQGNVGMMRTSTLCLMVFVLFASSACRRDSKPGKDSLQIYTPIQLTQQTHQLLEKLALNKEILLRSMNKTLKSSDWISLTKSNQKVRNRYTAQMAIRLRTKHLKMSSDKSALSFQLTGRMGAQLTPTDNKQEELTFHSQVEREYRFSKKVGYSRQWARKMLSREGRKVVEALWKQMGKMLTAFVVMRRDSSAVLRKMLVAGEPYQQLLATRILGQRKDPKAVKEIIKLLKHKDRRLMFEAISALVKMKEQQAVKPMIELTRGKKPAFLSHLISSLAEIGGQQVEGHLFTLAGAHPTKEIRVVAKNALQELKSRKKPSVSTRQ